MPRQKQLKDKLPFGSAVCSQQLSSLRHRASPEAPQKDQINYSKHRLIPVDWTLSLFAPGLAELSASWRARPDSSKGQTPRLWFAEEEINLAAHKYTICAIYILPSSLMLMQKLTGHTRWTLPLHHPCAQQFSSPERRNRREMDSDTWQHCVVFPH